MGCTVRATPLPACTPTGPLPAGMRYLHGTLEHARGYRQTLAAESVLGCRNTYSGGMGLLAEGKLHPLNGGITCSGDRSGICCPYAPGTKVGVVGAVGADGRIRDYFMCGESSGEPARVSPVSARPTVIEVETHPPLIPVFRFSAHHVSRPLGFWFGDRVVLHDPGKGTSRTIGVAGGPDLSCVAVSPGGSRALAVDVRGTGTLWDVGGGRALAVVPGVAPPSFPGRLEPDASCTTFLVQGLEWRPDERQLLVVTASSRTLLVDEATSGVRELAANDAEEAWFGAGGDLGFLTSHGTRGVDVRDLARDDVLARGVMGMVGRFPDGRLALCGPFDEAGDAPPCRQWNPRAADQPPRDLPFGCDVTPSPTGRFAAVAKDCFFGNTSWTILRDADFRSLGTVGKVSRIQWAAGQDVLGLETERGIEVWSERTAVRLAGKRLSPSRSEGDLLFSPDARVLATPHRILDLRARREIRFGKAVGYRSGAFSPDGALFAAWSLREEGPYYANETGLELEVFDVASGCSLLRLDEKGTAPSPRQAITGAAPPRFVPGTDALELPVFGSDSFARLVRPRTGETVFVTAIGAEAPVPVALSADGRYDGSDTPPSEALARPGSPTFPAPLRPTPGLLRDFFARSPAARPATCKKGTP